MKRFVSISAIFFLLAGFLFIEACKKTNEFNPSLLQFDIPQGWPQPVYNFQNNPLTVQGVELGRKLFYDGLLSKDGGFPCSSCHQQVAGFGTFDHDLSHGYNNSHTLRNAPPLQNLAWHTYYNADGSETSLEKVILKHLSTPIEMGETVENVVLKLNNEPAYKPLFKAAFNSENADAEKLSKALSQFVLTLVSSNSKYDKVKRGTEVFNDAEQRGYDLFKAKCVSCHTEPLFTDLQFRNTGIPMDHHLKDEGRKRVTRVFGDSLKFKVASLRNVEKTFPYGHDGRFLVLDNILEHYRSGVVDGPTTDLLVKNKIPMTNFEFGMLKAFMHSLTDTAFINNKKLAAP